MMNKMELKLMMKPYSPVNMGLWPSDNFLSAFRWESGFSGLNWDWATCFQWQMVRRRWVSSSGVRYTSWNGWGRGFAPSYEMKSCPVMGKWRAPVGAEKKRGLFHFLIPFFAGDVTSLVGRMSVEDGGGADAVSPNLFWQQHTHWGRSNCQLFANILGEVFEHIGFVHFANILAVAYALIFNLSSFSIFEQKYNLNRGWSSKSCNSPTLTTSDLPGNITNSAPFYKHNNSFIW